MDHQRFDSVWDALSPTSADARQLRMRADLLIAIEQQVRGWNLTQAEAGKRLGVTQPRLNDLLRGKIDKFSLEALILLAEKANLSVRLDVSKAA